MSKIHGCVLDLSLSLIDHIEKRKLHYIDLTVIKKLSDKINSILPEQEKKEERQSIKITCRQVIRELQNHSGELTESEKKSLIEMIEAAAHVMLFY
jgi:microcompartment protein CcmL/EutN